eukprot:GILK01013355.1.p1 GENE.GILK01013355.1~~GILK01013355.1.p1  ORF type:complete len:346 (-),score=18.68 GILK01013355.1:267-1304(-)
MPDLDFEVLLSMMTYLYTAKYEESDPSALVDMLVTSNKWCDDRLMQLCQARVYQLLDGDSAWRFLEKARHLEITDMNARCLRLVSRSTRIPGYISPECLTYVLAGPDMNNYEIEIWKLLTTWLDQHPDDEASRDKLTGLIRFVDMTDAQILEAKTSRWFPLGMSELWLLSRASPQLLIRHPPIPSKILSEQQFSDMAVITKQPLRVRLLYASDPNLNDGSLQRFHQGCDGKYRTLLIVKAQNGGKVYVCYTSGKLPGGEDGLLPVYPVRISFIERNAKGGLAFGSLSSSASQEPPVISYPFRIGIQVQTNRGSVDTNDRTCKSLWENQGQLEHQFVHAMECFEFY